MYIAVDFDGTIADHVYPEIGSPVPRAFEWMKAWQHAGAKLILWTMRNDSEKDGPVLTDAVEFCRKNGIEFYGVNSNPSQDWSNSPKAYAHIYVDDAAFGCPLAENPRSGGRDYVDWDVVGPDVFEKIVGINKTYDLEEVIKELSEAARYEYTELGEGWAALCDFAERMGDMSPSLVAAVKRELFSQYEYFKENFKFVERVKTERQVIYKELVDINDGRE